MARVPTGRRSRHVQPEIHHTFISMVYNISSNLGSTLQQRSILSKLRIAHSNPNNITSHHRCPHGTRIRPLPPPLSNSTTLTENPFLQIRCIPLARQPLLPLQQICHRLGTCTIICPDCNALHWIEERSRKGTRQVPKFSTCCMNGGIWLSPLPDAPILIEELLKDESNGNKLDLLETHLHSWVLL